VIIAMLAGILALNSVYAISFAPQFSAGTRFKAEQLPPHKKHYTCVAAGSNGLICIFNCIYS